MALKDILVHIDEGPNCDKRAGLAMRLAKRQNARLFALYALSDSNVLGISSDRDKCRKQHKRNGEAACKRYQKMADKLGVELEWETAKFATSDEMVGDQMVHATQHVDLAVVGQFDTATANGTIPPDLAERLLLESGRPVLVVPWAGEFKQIGKRVVIAWNTGRESVRAVNDAIPLLGGAKRVQIFAIDPRKGKKRHGSIPSADIANHLARHGIAATPMHLNTRDLDPANTLLSVVADESADLLVMGAYGHKRLREKLLGGVTQDILSHMTVPVLMSH